MKNLVYRPATAAVLLSRAVLCAGLACGTAVPGLLAQAPAAAAPAPGTRALGTVKSIAGNVLTVSADAGGALTSVTVGDTARVQQSADMKTVSPSSFAEIAVGDRVLATGTPGAPGTLTATRVILIKSAAIAQRNQSTQADWNRRGSGGIVTAVDPAANTITISSGKRTVTINTAPSTIYRRYAPGSIKFEDAKPGTLADLHTGDQLRVRGDKSPDGATVTAEEIVSGSFRNLAGTIVSVNPAANTLVLKDLATKKNETVTIGDGSDLRNLPPEIAARFAPARARTAAAGAPAAATAAPAAAGAEAPAGERRPGGYGGGAGGNGAPGGYAGGAGRGPGGPGGRPGGGGAGDLAQLIPRLPATTLADLKTGEALMIVASGNGTGGPLTAITVLSGVEPLLTGPAGSEMTISPWSLGSGGGGEGGGATE